MTRKKKMTAAQKASARWSDANARDASEDNMLNDEEPSNGDHFVISLALIGVVAIAAIVFTTMQGGVPF